MTVYIQYNNLLSHAHVSYNETECEILIGTKNMPVKDYATVYMLKISKLTGSTP